MTKTAIQTNSKKIREDWLLRAGKLIDQKIMRAANVPPMPKKWAVSVGWPRGSKKAIGQCWSPIASGASVTEMFISPELSDPIEVLAVLLHEMIHAAVGVQHRHGKPFKKAATDCGLVGKITATVAGPLLIPKLKDIAKEVGKFPHAQLNDKVSTKARAKSDPWPTFHCTSDPKYRIQIRPQALELYGPPISPINGEEMVRAEGRMKRKNDDE